ncbi:MAG: hypothetical protein ACM3VT_11770 [Solirubrobacterales bacterium]
MDERLQTQRQNARGEADGQMLEQVVLLYSRSLRLLSDCSRYVPDRLKDDIERLAHDSRKAAIPVRVERSNGVVTIDPFGIPG